MSGHDDYNFPAFNELAAILRARGFVVRNPAEYGADPAMSWADCLKRDLIDMMLNAKIVVRLPGWENSRGSSLECDVATRLGMGIVDLSELLEII